MSIATRRPSTNRIILRNVSWETYERLLKDLENRSSPRLTYDRGVLEIMSRHFEHDRAKEILGYIAVAALEETGVDFESAAPTTYKREDLERGFEPDGSFYIRSAQLVRRKKRLDMTVDPPPDLVLEIDVSGDSMDKLPLYAAMQVQEVWRFKDRSVEIRILEEARYVRRAKSLAIPVLDSKLISELMEASLHMQRPAWARHVRRRIRELLEASRA